MKFLYLIQDSYIGKAFFYIYIYMLDKAARKQRQKTVPSPKSPLSYSACNFTSPNSYQVK